MKRNHLPRCSSRKGSRSMLSTYDMQCLSRLEDRWLDPDCNAIPEDEEDDEFWDQVDRDVEDRWFEKLREGGL